MANIQAPVAKRVTHECTLHGDMRVDDYYWLRERGNKEVLDYLEAENQFTEASTKHLETLKKKLYEEMLGRIKEDDSSVPVQDGDYWYYTRTETGKAYRIYCRKKENLEAPEEILLDVNELAKGKQYTRVGVFKVSPNHELLAYSVDYSGDERFGLRVKKISSGEHYDEMIEDTYYGTEWGNDNETLFYTTVDETMRPYRLHRHQLGTSSDKDVVVLQEDDDRFYLWVYKSRTKKFIIAEIESAITTEVHLIDADTHTQAPVVVEPRRQGIEYGVAHHGEHLLILTNENAVNFKLMITPVNTPGAKHWKELIPHRENVMISDVDEFRDFIVLYERENALTEIRIQRLEGGDPMKVVEDHRIEFPDAVFTSWGGDTRRFASHVLRFGYSSLVQPDSTYDYDVKTKDRVLKKEKEVIGYDKSRYACERVWADANDGLKIPISLHYKKSFERNGKAPMLLTGYGSYGICYDPEFESNLVSFTDRGFVVAIAHIRGGGDLGRKWKDDGKLEKKMNTFTDFIACTEHLVKEKYAAPDRIGIMGASAGGLLMGAVINLRPELFTAVVARVPFVDVINTMMDETIPLTVIEWEEWGNPNTEKDYRTMLTYSPYDNIVAATKYPDILITSGLNDPRVQYWEPAKWTAKLRATDTGDHVLLLKTNMGAGHAGASGRYGYLEEKAFEYAFLIDRLTR